MKAVRSCETPVTNHPMTGRHIPKTIMLKISLLFITNGQIKGKLNQSSWKDRYSILDSKSSELTSLIKSKNLLVSTSQNKQNTDKQTTKQKHRAKFSSALLPFHENLNNKVFPSSKMTLLSLPYFTPPFGLSVAYKT